MKWIPKFSITVKPAISFGRPATGSIEYPRAVGRSSSHSSQVRSSICCRISVRPTAFDNASTLLIRSQVACRALQTRAMGILEQAERTGDLRTALAAIGQARGVLELQARVTGETAIEQAGSGGKAASVLHSVGCGLPQKQYQCASQSSRS